MTGLTPTCLPARGHSESYRRKTRVLRSTNKPSEQERSGGIVGEGIGRIGRDG